MKKVKERPGKVAIANIKIDEEQMREIVQSAMEEFKQQLIKEPEEPEQTNKPINMMKALFNFKEDE